MIAKIAGALVGTLFLLQHVKGQSCVCKCGPTGLFGEDDLHSKPSGPLVVRPKALIKPTLSLPLFGPAVKGPCFRRQTIVKPAVVPRPVYTQVETQAQTGNNKASAVAAAAQLLTQSCSNSNTNALTQGISQAASTILGSGTQGAPCSQVIDVSSAYHKACTGASSSAPADAVSLAIAYKQSQNNYNKKIAEDRLAYGFRKIPIEQPQLKRTVYKQVLPEESLYTLNGQIVELKPISEQNTCDSLSEEAQEELLDLAVSEEVNDVRVARRPSLDELGYGPAKIASATFVDLPSATPPVAPVVPPPATPCNDGFKSGTVEYKDFSKFEHIQRGADVHTSCESQEEAVRTIPIPAPSCHCTHNGKIANVVRSFSSSAKSCSSSSSSAHSKNILLEKLC